MSRRACNNAWRRSAAQPHATVNHLNPRAAPAASRRLPAAKRGKLRLEASRDGREGSVVIHQDVNLFATLLEPGESVSERLSTPEVQLFEPQIFPPLAAERINWVAALV